MSRDAHDSRTDPANSAPSSGLRCWFCSHRLELEYVRRDGLLRGRDDRQGGPYRLYDCPICNRSNHCEKTKKGRWFSSPTFQPNLLDYIGGKLITPAQEFLRAAAWYRENEERRCYFFERDGDLRYSSGAWLRRWLAPAGNDDDKIDEKRRHTEREQERKKADDRRRHWDRERQRERDRAYQERQEKRREERRRASVAGSPSVMSPWEILGVERDSDAETIRRAFHRLAVQYHPDKVHHMGEDFQREAHARFTELQRSYDEMLRRAQR